jgi:hypothetical protein
MDSPQWRDGLIKELRRQRLPEHYAARLVEELTDHADDLFQENLGMDAKQDLEVQLGNPKQLAAVAKAEFQRRTFAARHPVVAFVVAPIVAPFGALIATCLCIEMAMELVGVFWNLDAISRGQTLYLIHAVDLLVRFVPFVLSAWLFVRIGQRSGERNWSIGACGIVALIAVIFQTTLYEGVVPGGGSWSIGFGLRLGLDQILQAAVPIALGVWVWRQTIAHLSPELAVE